MCVCVFFIYSGPTRTLLRIPGADRFRRQTIIRSFSNRVIRIYLFIFFLKQKRVARTLS